MTTDLGLSIALAKLSFEKAKLQKRIDRAKIKVLKRQGGYVRTVERRSIRRTSKRTTVSPPGDPPRSHDPHARYKLIRFAYDSKTDSVVVGHVKLGRSRVPEVHEKGLRVRTKVTVRRRLRATASQRRAFKMKYGHGQYKKRKTSRVIRKVVSYPKRPAAAPALEKSAPALAEMWKDTVK